MKFSKKITSILIFSLIFTFFIVSNCFAAPLYSIDTDNPDIIKADLTKMPKMYNSKTEVVQAIPTDDGISLELNLHLDPGENRKDSRVIEFNKKTLTAIVETGTLEEPTELNKSLTSSRAYTYTQAEFYSGVYDPLGITVNSVATFLTFSYNGSNIGSFGGSYSTFTYHGISNWYTNYAYNSSYWMTSPTSACSSTNAQFYNYDFADPSLITTVTYTNHQARGYASGAIDGWINLSIQGEYWWLLLNTNSLYRVY